MKKNFKIVGLVLAGGRSSRMGGGDKGLLDLNGGSMMAHVIERLAPQVRKLVINANGDPGRFAEFGLPVVADSIEDYAGPLAGILAGMRWSAALVPEASHMVSVSTDAPFIPNDLVERLWASLAAGNESIALASSNGELHPVIGMWPVALADDLEFELKAGTRKVLKWTGKHGTVPVDFPPVTINGQPVDPFFNANTLEDLDLARNLLHSRSQHSTQGRS